MRGRRSSWASDSRPKHRRLLLPRHVFGRTGDGRRASTRRSRPGHRHGRRHPAVRDFRTDARAAGQVEQLPRSVAQRIGADPARAILEPIGGQGPQHLVTEFASAIAAGSRRGDVVRLREHLQPPALRGPRRQTGPIRDRRGITRRPGLRIRRHLRRVHHRARIARRPSAIRAAGERSTGPAGPQASRTTGSAWANCSRRSPQSPPRIRSRRRRSSARSTSSPRSPRATG